MSQLKADIADLKDAPFTTVGVNVDADKERGRALTASLELTWAQNYVGEHSDLTRQLAVSSVPAYYLIGPEGKLIGSSSDWQEMRKLLKENLRH